MPMHPFEFVIAILVLTFAYKLIQAWVAARGARRTDNTANEDLLRRLADVEGRVQVLERIVTDERYDLKRQFKDLGA